MNDSMEAARAAFFDGVSRYEAGDAVSAVRCFEEALRLAPGRVSVLVNLGAARMKLGQAEAALAAFDAALGAEPQHADAWCHRGLALADLDRHDDALTSLDHALALDPALSAAGYGRAATLSGLRRHAETLQALDELLKHDEDHGPGLLLRGQTLQMLDRHDESLGSYRRAVAAQPELGLAWMLLGQRLAELGNDDEAAAAFERALALGFEVETNRYLLAALGRAPMPPGAPAAYVRALFDGYADDFETHLVGTLRYRAHEHVAQAALAAVGTAQRGVASALDLGCGTGLCGALLRPHVRWLGGIDLSTTMIDAARRRGVYDELVQAELLGHLQATPLRHDLVVCADTFIYLGDLAPAFGGVRRVLQDGGHFVFSVERADDALAYVLTTQLRYAHSERYLRELAAAHGLTMSTLRPVDLREEQGRAVGGLVVACHAAPRA
jgi:predicted TPR repeat methyltransferase